MVIVLPESTFRFDFDKADYSLVSVHCDVWSGFIFVNLADEPSQTLTDFLGPMITAMDGYPFEKQTERFFYRATDYGGIKDTQEVWWDPKAIAPDGQPGHYQSVDGGHRYLLGQWPTTPTAVFDPRCLPLGSCGAPNAP